jgi:hypothetical protein
LGPDGEHGAADSANASEKCLTLTFAWILIIRKYADTSPEPDPS